jgi:hypothetical protein
VVVEAGGGLQATCRAASTCEKRADIPRAFYFERLFAVRVLLSGVEIFAAIRGKALF